MEIIFLKPSCVELMIFFKLMHLKLDHPQIFLKYSLNE